MSFPDAATLLCAVLGDPVRHSLSPAIHNAALRHAGSNGVYLAFQVSAPGFAAAVEGLQRLSAVGVNVTIPHKEAAFAAATSRSEGAERVGAANTLRFRPDGIEAHNTDPAGVLGALADLGVDPSGARALVLGAGGAGRAAAWGLADAGAAGVLIANRTAAKAADLAGALQAGSRQAESIAWEELGPVVGGVDLIVNSTSVGLGAEEMPLRSRDLDAAAVGGCRLVLDLVYAPGETLLVRTARESGLPAADGVSVLVHQAVEAYRIFWDADPSVEAMRDAAAAALGRRRLTRGEDADSVPPLV